MRLPDRDPRSLQTRIRLDDSLWCISLSGPDTEPFGFPTRAILGKPFADQLTPAEAPTIIETLRAAADESVGASIVAAFDQGPMARWLELSVSPIDGRGPDGAVLEIGLCDVTVRVAEEMRLRASLAVERVVSGVATRLAGWPDGELDVALRLCLEDVALRFGAVQARLLRHPRHAGEVSVLGRWWRGTTDAPAFAASAWDAWLCTQIEAGHRVEAMPLDVLPAAADALRQGLTVAGIRALMVMPCDYARGEGEVVLELGWQTSRGRLEAEEARLLGRLAELFAGWFERRRAAARRSIAFDGDRARDAFERQMALEHRVAELSRFFIDLEIEDLCEGIVCQLGAVAELVESEHSWLYAFASEDVGVEFFDWWQVADGGQAPAAADRSLERFPYSTRLIRSGQPYRVPRIETLPAEAAAEIEDMRARGVRSILCIPLVTGGRFVGCVGFESFEREVDWSDETLVLLRMVGEIFYSALRRRRAAEDLRDSQIQLLQAQKMEAVGTLAGGIAHDFNNHLAVMLGNARFIRQEVEASSEVLEAIEDLERSADHCAQLTRSLLAFSRRSPVAIGPVEVGELVRGVEGLVRPLLPEAIQLETTLGPELGSFAVDRVQIQQVLVNLLVNARDAMPGGGSIRMQASRRPLSPAEAVSVGLPEEGAYVVLSVIDTGCGMESETLARVFDPFFTTKDQGSGTGLGLAMAYGIVRQSGGAIAIESEPGQGSTFRVYLPGFEDETPI